MKQRSQPLLVTPRAGSPPGPTPHAGTTAGQDSRCPNKTRTRSTSRGFLILSLTLCLIFQQLPAQTTVCFSPGGQCENRILTELNGAKQSVRVQAYNFTSARIINGLTTLKKRGILVIVILDKSWRYTAPNAEAAFTAAGIPVLIDRAHPVAHAKVIIIDKREVFCGSYNWTNNAANRNSEDLLLTTDPALVVAFIVNWQLHAAHSAPP